MQETPLIVSGARKDAPTGSVDTTARWRPWLRTVVLRARPYLGWLAVSAVLATIATSSIITEVGRPGSPLDDSFIHYRYAQQLAQGHFFEYVPGSGYTSGATSLLWPIILAPFWLIGFRGLAIIVATWLLGTILHAATAREVFLLARPLTGRSIALGAGAMSLSFGAFAWFAWSGMETMALTWALVRGARLSADWTEGSDEQRLPRSMMGLAIAAPLIRPEGALVSLLCAASLLVRRCDDGKGGKVRQWLWPVVPLLGPTIAPLMHWTFTGHAASATTQVKWLIGNPYYPSDVLGPTIWAHIRLLWQDILQGGTWGAIFIPEGTGYALVAGLVSTVILGALRKRPYRAAFVVLVALAALVPTTYLSFLWNRVRYVWPFAGAWFVALACFAATVGLLVQRLRPGLRMAGPLLAAAFAGAFATKLPWTIRDLATSARAIDRQQVTLGEWARHALPVDAKIGVNDTGAIAYLSHRETFDVVGLTTMGEARYWVAGAGSRYEHYERLGAEALPTHFIVYPQWMAMEPVLGSELHRATVTDQSILGGTTKIAYLADWSVLGRADTPTTLQPPGPLLDELDVSDLDSEKAHQYELGRSSSQSNVVFQGRAQDGESAADGGRQDRRIDRFSMLADTHAGATVFVMRAAAPRPVTLRLSIDDEPIGEMRLAWSDWSELAWRIPSERHRAGMRIAVTAVEPDRTFSSMHYWLFESALSARLMPPVGPSLE